MLAAVHAINPARCAGSSSGGLPSAVKVTYRPASSFTRAGLGGETVRTFAATVITTFVPLFPALTKPTTVICCPRRKPAVMKLIAPAEVYVFAGIATVTSLPAATARPPAWT